MARVGTTLSVTVADSAGKPEPNATVIATPEAVMSTASLSGLMRHAQTDLNGNYTAPSVALAKFRVLATTQAVRWNVLDDRKKCSL
jgi:hypothetical protein